MSIKIRKTIKITAFILTVSLLLVSIKIIARPMLVNAAVSLLGDLNTDGKVNSKDLSKLQRMILGMEIYTIAPQITPTPTPVPTPTPTPIPTPTPYVFEYFNSRTCSIFHRVCCIGDSATSGHIDYGYATDGTLQEGVRMRRNEEYAWPAYMEKITGNEYINLGISGATALYWLESAEFDAEDKTIKIKTSWSDKDPISGEIVHDSFEKKVEDTDKISAYLIGLGMNDTAYEKTDADGNPTVKLELGTSNDIGTDAKNFCGSYSRLIEKIHEVSPRAKIFVQTMHENMSDARYEYNEAVKYIANYYSTREEDPIPVHVLDLYQYKELYDADSIDDDKLGGHWTAISYQQFAEILCRIWSEYINTHLYDFKDVHLTTR